MTAPRGRRFVWPAEAGPRPRYAHPWCPWTWAQPWFSLSSYVVGAALGFVVVAILRGGL